MDDKMHVEVVQRLSRMLFHKHSWYIAYVYLMHYPSGYRCHDLPANKICAYGRIDISACVVPLCLLKLSWEEDSRAHYNSDLIFTSNFPPHCVGSMSCCPFPFPRPVSRTVYCGLGLWQAQLLFKQENVYEVR